MNLGALIRTPCGALNRRSDMVLYGAALAHFTVSCDPKFKSKPFYSSLYNHNNNKNNMLGL